MRARLDSDVPALQVIVELTAAHDRYPPYWPPSMGRFPAPGDRRAELASYVAVSEAGPVAHVALHDTDADGAAEVAAAAIGVPATELAVAARLFVHPAHRRSGLARQLLDRVVSDAHNIGRRPILDVWAELSQAIAFYEKCGWQRAADIEIHFRSPCTDRCAHTGASIRSYVYLGPSR